MHVRNQRQVHQLGKICKPLINKDNRGVLVKYYFQVSNCLRLLIQIHIFNMYITTKFINPSKPFKWKGYEKSQNDYEKQKWL